MIRAALGDQHGQPIKHQGFLFGGEVGRPHTKDQPQKRPMILAANCFAWGAGLRKLKQQVRPLHQELLMPRVGQAKPTIVLRPRIELCRAGEQRINTLLGTQCLSSNQKDKGGTKRPAPLPHFIAMLAALSGSSSAKQRW